MKNMVIAMLLTYIFWTDCCVIHPMWALPIVFGAFWAFIAEGEEILKDYSKSLKRGQYLTGKIRKMRRDVI